MRRLAMLQAFLSLGDADRALRTFRKLARHDIQTWALTGGLAVEFYCLHFGLQSGVRALNDIDFVAESFDCIPTTLSSDFLFRHIHPSAPPGKTMMQCVDADSALRVDVFRTCGAAMSRTRVMELASGTIRVASPEDLIARVARLTMDLTQGVPTLLKHAEDFFRLDGLVASQEVEPAWRDHRKAEHPESFAEVRSALRAVIPEHPELLVASTYSRDVNELCARCASTSNFRLADPNAVLALLGYC